MKITDVRAVQPQTPESPADWRTSLGQILVAIDTDVGLTGYGVGGGGRAGIHVVRTVLRDLLLGRNAEPVEELWQEMYSATLAFGRKGLAVMALSGVDLALWDLRGKAANQPVAALLGGKVGEPLPTYTTVWGAVDPEIVAEHSAFKLHVDRVQMDDPVAETVQAVEAARAVVGSDRDLMLDAWMRWDVELTLALDRALRPFDLDWVEEPLSPDDLAGYARLAEECVIPIAGGEHEFTAIGFAPLIEGRLHQVLQPDVCWCGGMTELIKIYEAAREAGLQVCPHRGSELWSLHAIAALDAAPLAESGRPWMTWVAGQPPIVEGTITLGDAPGLGVTIDETTLAVMPD
ncbi:MAG: L-rhamnonate dehydratase [Planctomycetaceae bacterium]|nr:L-rhamnonate dehydratase [Planctomycetaceae bacterium]